MTVGDDIQTALNEMVQTMETLPGAYRPEFSLTFWAGVAEGAEAWSCTVEGDIHGDDGDTFTVLGHTATEVLVLAREETLRRVP
jgi:hypothetical protein